MIFEVSDNGPDNGMAGQWITINGERPMNSYDTGDHLVFIVTIYSSDYSLYGLPNIIRC